MGKFARRPSVQLRKNRHNKKRAMLSPAKYTQVSNQSSGTNDSSLIRSHAEEIIYLAHLIETQGKDAALEHISQLKSRGVSVESYIEFIEKHANNFKHQSSNLANESHTKTKRFVDKMRRQQQLVHIVESSWDNISSVATAQQQARNLARAFAYSSPKMKSYSPGKLFSVPYDPYTTQEATNAFEDTGDSAH